ncbi:MAG TPA: hypothetical protein VEC14_09425, partial [Reyranellaceae bacterium]|nr:hypothetical protein [Reyranellaceae bacterium]
MFGVHPFGAIAFGAHIGSRVDPSPFTEALEAGIGLFLAELEAYPLSPEIGFEAGFGAQPFGFAAFASGDAALSVGVRTLRYSGAPYTTAATDTPASTPYDHRLQRLTVERRLDGGGLLGGLARVFGELELLAVDGGLDSVASDYALSGRPARFKMGPSTRPCADFGPVATLRMGLPWLSRDTLRIALEDYATRLNQPVQGTVYAGTGGLEGGTDLAGRPKPLTYGYVSSVSAPLVDSARLIYQVHDGQVQGVPAVYDRGVSLTQGADYASFADLLATSPSLGQYRVYKPSGFIRLGSTPAGEVTFDVEGDASGGFVATPADILKRLLRRRLYDTEIDFVSLAQLGADLPYAAGLWIPPEAIALEEVIRAWAESLGGWAGFNRFGGLGAGIFTAPTGGAAFYLAERDLDALDREALPAELSPVVWRVSVGYRRNYTVQTDLAASVTEARRSFAANEYRWAVAEDTGVLSRYLGAQELVITGPYKDLASAQAEATRLLAFWNQPRALYRVVTGLTALRLDLGAVVSLDINRFGL